MTFPEVILFYNKMIRCEHRDIFRYSLKQYKPCNSFSPGDSCVHDMLVVSSWVQVDVRSTLFILPLLKQVGQQRTVATWVINVVGNAWDCTASVGNGHSGSEPLFNVSTKGWDIIQHNPSVPAASQFSQQVSLLG